jgi:hypothetical protein
MTISRFWGIWIGVAMLLLVGWSGFEWLQEHDARITSATKIAQFEQQVKDNAAAQAKRDTADKQQQQDAQKAKAEVTTAPQAVKIITQLVQVPTSSASSTQAQAVAVTPQDLTPQVQAQLPNSPSYMVTTQAQSTATAQALIQCGADQKSLDTCKSDNAGAAVALTAMTADRDNWKSTANGGTFWQRFKHDAIVITVTAGAAYAAGRLTK